MFSYLPLCRWGTFGLYQNSLFSCVYTVFRYLYTRYVYIKTFFKTYSFLESKYLNRIHLITHELIITSTVSDTSALHHYVDEKWSRSPNSKYTRLNSCPPFCSNLTIRLILYCLILFLLCQIEFIQSILWSRADQFAGRWCPVLNWFEHILWVGCIFMSTFW